VTQSATADLPARATADGDDPSRRGDWRWPLLAYVAVFALLAARFLPLLASAVPENPNLEDAHVLPWVLAWVAHALAVDPRALFDANVSYPAPLQLTGTDPLFAAQLLFAPLYAATRNPVLSANLVVLLSYPLAALAMERLLRRFAVSRGIAWVAGLVFALGVLRVPFNLNELAYPNLFLPWTALALTRLRDQPSLRRAAALLLAFTTGVFAGLYAAVLVGAVAAVWGAFELARGTGGRIRFVVSAAAAALFAATALLVAMHPYLVTAASRSNAGVISPGFRLSLATVGAALQAIALIVSLYPQSAGLEPRRVVEIVLLVSGALLAIVAWVRHAHPSVRLVPRALTLWLVFGTLAWGYPPLVSDLVIASPLVSFRYLYRYVVPGDFGLVILLAVALEALRARAGARIAGVVTTAVVVLVLWSRGVPFADTTMHRVAAFTPEARAAYAQAARIVADGGGGALLELPIYGLVAGVGPGPRTIEPDAMLASTLHWWSTPAAHLSYHPPHRAFFMATVGALPVKTALQDLVDLTHVRWLLVRPEEQWPAGTRQPLLNGLAHDPDVGETWPLGGGWVLLRLDRPPQHQRWYDTVRSGIGTRDRSVLGSSLDVIPDASARSSVQIETAPASGTAGQNVVAVIAVRNDGDRPWPALATPLAPLTLDGRWPGPVSRERTVVVAERWHEIGPDGNAAPETVAERERYLRRDVDPGEVLREMLGLTLPAKPGTYELELGVKQRDGAAFDGTGNVPARRRFTVSGAPPQESKP
jgi:hypothetical protein